MKDIKFQDIYGAKYSPEYVQNSPIVYKDIALEVLNLPWITKRTARHEYFMSDHLVSYTYGNRGTGNEEYVSKEFTPEVKKLMTILNDDLGTEFNACFLNKYDDQHQHLGWHADDFNGMRQDQPIAVVTFGAEREIWVKDKRGYTCFVCQGSKQINELRCTSCQGTGFIGLTTGQQHPITQRCLLGPGSLFLMPVGYQDTHLHRIPKHDRPCGVRISLTFRSFK